MLKILPKGSVLYKGANNYSQCMLGYFLDEKSIVFIDRMMLEPNTYWESGDDGMIMFKDYISKSRISIDNYHIYVPLNSSKVLHCDPKYNHYNILAYIPILLQSINEQTKRKARRP